ncbi:TylF/MycF/NovP-related O-methyltransferase [Lacrimispora aerotolerans]|uniref:TylF/MycF/NovP-related O-methyltransferase n=1 Tax=Lacrimispora aerotolerans TaxID=36832 RepID=UPI000689F076|nr:TylF/MycF/NovP-related O-methyltransferase [Lacrimispora aerotolerans]
MKKKIILWGCGERAKRYIEYEYFKECDIVAVIDTYHKGETFEGYQVYGPEDLSLLLSQGDFLVISSLYFSDIYNTYLELGFPKEKVIFTDIIQERIFENDLDQVKNLSPQLYKDILLNQYRLIQMNEKDFFDNDKLVGVGRYSKIEYMNDYFRYRSFEFMAEELLEDGMVGDVAEFGVFRGVFARLINEKFKDKKLFLFDTFEGFDKIESEKEAALGRCDNVFIDYHMKTSEEQLMAQLPYPDKCVICKGLFPDSISKEAFDTRYVFVSIDVDFEDSIFAGIDFFYPRLVNGGVIFLHDYNSAYLHGVRNAVKRYEDYNNLKLKKVPFADRAGTLVIIK